MSKISENYLGDYLNYEDCKTVKEVLQKYKAEIQRLIVEAVDISFNGDYQEMLVTKIRDPQSYFKSEDIILFKPNWNDCLDKALIIFLEVEDYEFCAYVRDLKERINTDFSGHPEYGSNPRPD